MGGYTLDELRDSQVTQQPGLRCTLLITQTQDIVLQNMHNSSSTFAHTHLQLPDDDLSSRLAGEPAEADHRDGPGY